MVNGKWTSTVEEVKGEAFRFFKNKFTENRILRPKIISPNFKTLSMMESIKLEAPFSMEEVKDAVWACGSEKAPGPDGIMFKLIKI